MEIITSFAKIISNHPGIATYWVSLEHVPILNQSVWPKGWGYADGPPGPHDTQTWGED